MIKAIVFDFDEMVHVEEGYFSKWVAEKFNLSEEILIEFFRNEFSLCRVGKLDTKKTLKKYLSKAGWEKGVDKFLEVWADYGYTDKELIDLIRQLRNKGITCILCTNNEKYRMKHFLEEKKLKDEFDHMLLSAELGYLKPEQPMLQKILEIAGVKKDEILFCDDKVSFVEAADEFGFQTYRYKNFGRFKFFLEKIKIFQHMPDNLAENAPSDQAHHNPTPQQ